MIHVARKVGFVEEGRAKKAHYWNGEWIDRCDFGMLKQEWEDLESCHEVADELEENGRLGRSAQVKKTLDPVDRL